MRVRHQQARTRSTRAILICAALACLCASDGVGPRLLPYPSLTPPLAAAHAAGQRAPAHPGQTDAARDEPGGQTARAGDASSKLPVFSAQEPTFIRPAPTGQKAGALSTTFNPSASASLRAGRAPPLEA